MKPRQPKDYEDNRLPSGWWILPALVLGIAVWAAIFYGVVL